MLRHRLNVRVDPPFRGRLRAARLRAVARLTLEREGLRTPAEVGLTVTDDATVRALNARYRGLDETTDVLAFGLTEVGAASTGGPFALPPLGRIQLGDVVLSYPQAERQARQAGHPVEHEAAILVAHGVLHLLGYDHAGPEEERVMFGKQETIVAEMEKLAKAHPGNLLMARW